jgi:hypothetical protein
MAWTPGIKSAKSQFLREKITEAERLTENVVRLMDIAQNGEARDSISAIKLLWAYGIGQPAQSVEVSGPDGQPIGGQAVDLSKLTPEEFAQFRALAFRAKSE